jgi:squalene cyclase
MPLLDAQDPWQPQSLGPAPRIGAHGEARIVVGIDGPTRLAIDRALEYLYRRQNADGSWSDMVGRKVHNTYRGRVAPHIGVTALAGMAFLSSGNLPDQGVRERYCLAVRKAIDFILDHTDPNGFINANGSRMYSHAFATLFLAEAYGTTLHPDAKRIQETLKRSVRLIVQSQNKVGGWRYLPGAPDADMSITVCQVMALRAARNAGIQVPKETIQNAVAYVKKSFLDTGPGMGAFRYQIEPEWMGVRHRFSFALTACGVTTLYNAGEYNAPQVKDGLRYLWNFRPPRAYARQRFDYYYGMYYAVQAAFQAGGDYWARWYEAVKSDLLALQDSDGSWTDLVGSNYATAMAAIILQLPNQYLPITEN